MMTVCFCHVITKQLIKGDWIFRPDDIYYWQMFNFIKHLKSLLGVFIHHWSLHTGFILQIKGLHLSLEYKNLHFLLLSAKGALQL